MFDDKLVIGNTLPVYYDPGNPEESVTNFAQIQRPADLFTNSMLSFAILFLVVSIWIFVHHQSRPTIKRFHI
jgi:hypothetical protein